MWIVMSILDRKAEEFQGIFLARNLPVGARLFSDSIRRGDMAMIASHPEDFVLCEIGVFDEDSGLLSGASEYRVIVEAKDVIAEHKSNGVS